MPHTITTSNELSDVLRPRSNFCLKPGEDIYTCAYHQPALAIYYVTMQSQKAISAYKNADNAIWLCRAVCW